MTRLISFAILLLFSASTQAQQLKNSSFESWITVEFNQKPTGWTSSNDFSVPIGPVGVTADSSSFDGFLSARIITTLIGFAAQPYAGFIVNGNMNVTGHYDVDSIFKAGEPFTGRPTSLIGYYKYTSEAMIEDWGHAFVLLKKYNMLTGKVDTVGFGSNTLLNPSEDYREFRVPISYDSNVEPDSIVVAFFSTYPTHPLAGGKLWIDNLSLDYSAGTDDADKLEDILIYPNPATDVISISGSPVKHLRIYTLGGQEIISKELINQIDISALPEGIYVIFVDTGQEVIQDRFVKAGK